MGMRSTCPSVAWAVRGESTDSTRTSTVVQRNFRPWFFCNAPGSNPASVSTWKPLQIPTIGPPSRPKASTAGLDGEADGLAHPYPVDALEAEGGQRPLDGRPLRIGDAGAEAHLHQDREPHFETPGQSENERPVIFS